MFNRLCFCIMITIAALSLAFGADTVLAEYTFVDLSYLAAHRTDFLNENITTEGIVRHYFKMPDLPGDVFLEVEGSQGEGIWMTTTLVLASGTKIRVNGAVVYGGLMPSFYFQAHSVPADMNLGTTSVNLHHRVGWVIVCVELPTFLDPSNINVSSVLLNDTVRAEPSFLIGDCNGNSVQDATLNFSRPLVEAFIAQEHHVDSGNVTLKITGQLSGGGGFEGYAALRIELAGDANSDGVVDGTDAAIIVNAFGCCPEDPYWDAAADTNADKIVDIYDALVLALHFAHST